MSRNRFWKVQKKKFSKRPLMTFYFWNWWTCIPELFKTHFYISEIFALVIRRLIIDMIMRLETKKYIGNNEFRLETKFVDGKQLIEGKIIFRLKSYIGKCWLETVIWRNKQFRNNLNWKHKIRLETKTYIGNIVMRLVKKM